MHIGASIGDLFRLDGRVAVVVGGSGALGGEMARALARAGARVAVLGRRIEACETVAHEIRERGGEAVAVAVDVLDGDSLSRAAHAVAQMLGPSDILVNAAGGNLPAATTGPERSFFALDIPAAEAVFATNFTGVMRCCQTFGRQMAEREQPAGAIVNIASMAGLRPLTRVGAYAAAKAAIINFTQWLAVSMARECGPAIRVNALAPGFFLTEQNHFLLVDQATGEWTARGEAILAHTPMGRFGAPADLTGALLWLVSPASAFVTGVVVPVDGGFSAFSGV